MRIYDQLDQDEVWIDGEGIEWPLAEMATSHRANLLAFLQRRAESLKSGYEWSFISGPMPSADTEAADMVDQAFTHELSLSAEEWLSEQPLVIALRELVARDQETSS